MCGDKGESENEGERDRGGEGPDRAGEEREIARGTRTEIPRGGEERGARESVGVGSVSCV